jgi:hypothetical protein
MPRPVGSRSLAFHFFNEPDPFLRLLTAGEGKDLAASAQIDVPELMSKAQGLPSKSSTGYDQSGSMEMPVRYPVAWGIGDGQGHDLRRKFT